MKCNGPDTAVAEFFDIAFGFVDHQMRIHFRIGIAGEFVNGIWSESDTWTEIAVLDIQMKITRILHRDGFIGERSQSSARERGEDDEHSLSPYP